MFPSVTFPTRRPNNWRTPALLAAAGLAASFLYVQAKKAAVERDYPPGGKFVDVDGVRPALPRARRGADRGSAASERRLR
jgi:hypothetical protein